MNIAEKLTTIAENEQKVFDSGYEKGKAEGDINTFWDYLTNYGNRSNYQYVFGNWGGEYVRPNRKIIPTSRETANSTFNTASKLKKIESDYFDFSQKERGTTNSSGFYFTMYNCSDLEEIEDIGMQADFSYYSTFINCRNLHTISKIRSDEDTQFYNTFLRCNALRNVNFEGVIGQNITITSEVLSKESIISIIEHLSDSASGKTLTLSQTAVDNMLFPITSEESGITYNSWDELIATKSNWTISLS